MRNNCALRFSKKQKLQFLSRDRKMQTVFHRQDVSQVHELPFLGCNGQNDFVLGDGECQPYYPPPSPRPVYWTEISCLQNNEQFMNASTYLMENN